jgi:hypothetical protein
LAGSLFSLYIAKENIWRRVEIIWPLTKVSPILAKVVRNFPKSSQDTFGTTLLVSERIQAQFLGCGYIYRVYFLKLFLSKQQGI